MERLRIEEEQKKPRAAFMGGRREGNRQGRRDRERLWEDASPSDGGGSMKENRRSSSQEKVTGHKKAKTARADEADVRENIEEADGHPTSSDEPPLVPPPHKYRDKDWWLSKDLIVKVLHKTLGDGQFYKQKGRVLKVENRYSGYIQMLNSGAVLRVDQKDLETVIPNIGGWIRVTLGVWRGHEGVIEALDVTGYCVHVMLKSGPLFESIPSARPFVLKHLPYEHVCRVERQAKSG